MKATSHFLCVSLITVGAIACSAGSTSTQGSDDGGTADAGAQKTGKAACDAYLNCAKAVTPDKTGTIVETYGSSSACWTGTPSEADACASACQSALTKLAESTFDAACIEWPNTCAIIGQPGDACAACYSKHCCSEYTASNKCGKLCSKAINDAIIRCHASHCNAACK